MTYGALQMCFDWLIDWLTDWTELNWTVTQPWSATRPVPHAVHWERPVFQSSLVLYHRPKWSQKRFRLQFLMHFRYSFSSVQSFYFLFLFYGSFFLFFFSLQWSETKLEDPRWAWDKQVHGMWYFPFSALTLLVGRQEGHPAWQKNWMLVCWWWWFDWSWFSWKMAVITESAFTPLVGRQEGNSACTKLGVSSLVATIWLELCTTYSSRCQHHFLGRDPKVDLIILEGEKCPSVRPSVRPQSFFDFNEIWYIGRGRWVMHDGMPYGRIQGQGQDHEPFKVWIPSIFETYLLRHLQWELASDH